MATTLDEMREAADLQAQIRRARGGDRDAFDGLVRLHFTRVYAFLHRMIGSHEDAEDLAQECFVKAWRSLPHFREEASFSTWISRIALHLAQDHHRGGARRTRERSLEDLEHAPAATAARDRRGEVEREVERALAQLPPRLRAAIVLRVLEGREYAEVAEITGVKPATARAHVVQARRMLLRLLGPRLGGGTGRTPRTPEGGR